MAGCPLHFQGRFHEGNCRERQDYPGKSRGIDLENLVGKQKTEIKNGHKEIRSKYEISGRFLIWTELATIRITIIIRHGFR